MGIKKINVEELTELEVITSSKHVKKYLKTK